MKEIYPSYKLTGTKHLVQLMPDVDRQILDEFKIYCGVAAGERKVNARFSEMLQIYDIIEKPYSDWQLGDLRSFLVVLNRSDRKAWTRKGLLTTLQLFIRWHYSNWSSRFNNLEDLRRLSRMTIPNNSDRYNESTLPSPEDIDRMVRKAKNPRDKLYILMAWEAGLPPKVELTLRWSNIKIDHPSPGISTLEYFRTKNRDSFVFPFGNTTTYYLKQWRQEYEFPDRQDTDLIFPSPRDREKPLSSTTAWKMLRRLAIRAGINKPMYQYLLRHRTLSENYDKFPEEIHRRLFGHVKGSNQTRTYSHTRDKQSVLKAALEKLHQVKEITSDTSQQFKEENDDLHSELSMMRDTLNWFRSELRTVKSQLGTVEMTTDSAS